MNLHIFPTFPNRCQYLSNFHFSSKMCGEFFLQIYICHTILFIVWEEIRRKLITENIDNDIEWMHWENMQSRLKPSIIVTSNKKHVLWHKTRLEMYISLLLIRCVCVRRNIPPHETVAMIRYAKLLSLKQTNLYVLVLSQYSKP